MRRTITILGCGSSGGVPRVGQGWGACDPSNPKNRRRRCSILVEQTTEDGKEVTRVLVDTSPDLRQQLLDHDVDRLDAILVTHPHADHINGIDDVRPLVIKARHRIALHMDDATAAVVRRSFAYIFETPPGSQYPPLLDHRRVESGEALAIGGPGGQIDVTAFGLRHGEIDALGYRFGDVAYTPDLNGIPDASVRYLEGLDVWIVDSLRYTRHPSHFSLEETLTWIDRMQPRRAVLTNLHTDMDFDSLSAKLPKHVEPAFDGLQLAC
jgi:phosphoribosyl 1,2-cyclic phosphate phosphodiesterase